MNLALTPLLACTFSQGGLYAKDSNLLAAHGLTKQFSGRMGSMWRILSDVTFPTIAYTTGHEFNRGIFKAFNDVHLEDLWIPFFCNSTDLNYSKMQIHTTGYAWRAVRASMTLAGLLPPLSENGSSVSFFHPSMSRRQRADILSPTQCSSTEVTVRRLSPCPLILN